jgi:hypothetical protein
MTGSPASNWRKSSSCEGGTCVEIGSQSDRIAMRDAKSQHSPVLLFTHTEWTEFLDGVRNGEFDPLTD